MRRLLFLVVLQFAFINLLAQNDFYKQELLNLADLSRLPLYRTGDIEQLSSYDRTDGNDDGFSGKYSYIRRDADGLVIADLKGPGVVNRIWTPTPATDTIKFYFDGEKKPRIAVPFIDLFTGKEFPFVPPLCGNQLGGYYCYLPIPYEKSLRIVYAGKNLRFHQTQYRSLQEKDNVKSFSNDLIANHKDVFLQIAATWSRQHSPLKSYGAELKTKKLNVVLRSGVEENIFTINHGARIVGIELGAGSDLVHAYRKVMLSARWDGETQKALELPLHDFFGFAFGKPSMQSVLLGADDRNLYSYLPMPFDKSAELKLKYDKVTSADPEELVISGTIYYVETKRNTESEGKLYVQSRREYNIPSAVPHLIAEVKGKGHYIGTTLIAQGLEDGHTRFFEGDDVATIDGTMKLHGTGSEDYFNGGWYAVMDKWDRGLSLPIHGSLAYDLMTSRTGGYRFYLSDKLNFNESFKLIIEHQPEAKTNVQTDYTSVAFFYADKPAYKNTAIGIDDKVKRISHRDQLTAQAMVFSLYWLATAEFKDPAMIFTLKKSDSWTSKVDLDEVSIALISLHALDKGRYKLYVEYGKTDSSGPFSIWQRSKKISDWISIDQGMSPEGKTIYAGDIEITDELNTITLRKKTSDDVSISINKFVFEKIE